jgi:hypothetical protein
MTGHSRRAAPNRRREESTELGTTFSWLFGLLPNAHGAGSGECRCHADFPDCISAHSRTQLPMHRPCPLPWKSGSRRFNSQPSFRGDCSELPHLIAFNPLPLLAAVSRDRREIRGNSDLRFARQQIKGGTCGYLTVVTCDAESAGSCKLFLHLGRVVPYAKPSSDSRCDYVQRIYNQLRRL